MEIKVRAYIEREKEMMYQADQYLGSFLRRANQRQFMGSGHESYGCVDLQLCTGLLDDKGKEIYDGDIVKRDGEIGVVGFVGGCFSWSGLCCLFEDVAIKLEVIGNKDENPELVPKYRI